MRAPRVSIAGLMGCIVVVAVGTAALLTASALSASLVFTLTLCVFLTAILGMTYRRGAARAFWVGFVLFGGSYLIASFGPWFEMAVEPHLLTSRVFGELYLMLHPTNIVMETYYSNDKKTYSQTDGMSYWNFDKRKYFFKVGHSLASLLLAYAGGMIAGSLYATRPRDTYGPGERAPRPDVAP
jgi:uncharacterized membrane protein